MRSGAHPRVGGTAMKEGTTMTKLPTNHLSLTITGTAYELRVLLSLSEWLHNDVDSQADDLPWAVASLLNDAHHAMGAATLKRFGWMDTEARTEEWRDVARSCRSLADRIDKAIKESEEE